MKGERRIKILQAIENSFSLLEELFFVFTLPYGSSIRKVEYALAQRRKKARLEKDEREKRIRFNDLLYRLRKDGLVEEKGKGDTLRFELTLRGEKYLKNLRSKKLPDLPSTRYEHHHDDALKIVIFDIPEREKRKRVWLRSALGNLKFNMLQRSVWIGKTKLPDQFLADLGRLDMLSYVEIFAVSGRGSLRRVQI